MFKGYRTFLFNGATLLVGCATVALQYIGQIGLEDVDVGRVSLGLALFNSVGNFYLRMVTTTPPGQSE